MLVGQGGLLSMSMFMFMFISQENLGHLVDQIYLECLPKIYLIFICKVQNVYLLKRSGGFTRTTVPRNVDMMRGYVVPLQLPSN